MKSLRIWDASNEPEHIPLFFFVLSSLFFLPMSVTQQSYPWTWLLQHLFSNPIVEVKWTNFTLIQERRTSLKLEKSLASECGLPNAYKYCCVIPFTNVSLCMSAPTYWTFPFPFSPCFFYREGIVHSGFVLLTVLSQVESMLTHIRVALSLQSFGVFLSAPGAPFSWAWWKWICHWAVAALIEPTSFINHQLRPHSSLIRDSVDGGFPALQTAFHEL